MEGEYLGCGFLLCGDFNRRNIRRLITQFQLKQLVDKPSRGDQIFYLVITNLPQLYNANREPINELLRELSANPPPFRPVRPYGRSFGPKARPVGKGSKRKTVSRGNTRASRKLELGHYFRLSTGPCSTVQIPVWLSLA